MKDQSSFSTKLKVEKHSIQRVIIFSKLVIVVSLFMLFLDFYNWYTGVWESHRSQFLIFLAHLYIVPLLLILIAFLKSQLPKDTEFNYGFLLAVTTLFYLPVVFPFFYVELDTYNVGSSISIYFLIFGVVFNLSTKERLAITIYFGLFYFIIPTIMGISYLDSPYHYVIGVALLALFYYLSKYTNDSEVIRFENEELLQAQKVKLQGLNQELVGANTSINSMNDSLKLSNLNLSNFASLAAHDIKAPLRTIGAFSNLIERRYKDKVDPKDKEFFLFINSSIKSLSSMVDQLLVFSKIPDHKSIEIEQVDLEDIINESVQLLEHEIRSHHVKIKITEKLPIIQGNQDLLKQLFLNLINNAIKFSKKSIPHPKVDISIKEIQPAKIEVSIKDNGIGIPSEYHRSIFEIFRKLNNPAEYEGSGMGLALCKRIVLAHNGKIWVESKEGQGANFIFTL